jgi:MobA/MobL family protein
MEWLDQSPPLTGGKASGSGGCYHLSFRSGSRSGGACAVSAHDYITRNDEYADPDRDPAIHVESGHMPTWARDDPREYWDAADLYERANGRLYVSADFALPRGLDSDDQVALVRDFANELTEGERLPYSWAIHAGLDRDGQEHNPHAHIMISERQNDAIERSREAWFRRANPRDPARGGAQKSRSFHGREWVEHARDRWASLVNSRLHQLGRSERVDHRSYERQGLDVEPGRHYGPAAAYMATRGVDHDRLTDAAAAVERQERAQRIDDQIRAIESDGRGCGRGSMTQDSQDERRRQQNHERYSPDQLDRYSAER